MSSNGDVLLAEACRSSYVENRSPVLEHHVYVGRERSSSLQLPTQQTPSSFSTKYISTSPTGGFRSLHDPEGRSCTPCARYQRRSGYQPKQSSGPGLLDEPSSFLNLSLSRVHAVKSDEGLTSTVEGRTNRLHVSRDNEQPLTGSLSKLHRRLSEGSFLGGGTTTTRTKSVDIDEEVEEEMDSLAALEPSRQRASTCPETKAFRRRLKAKMMMRPPSPPLPESVNILRRLSSEAISRSSGSLNGGCLAEELFVEDDEFLLDSCSNSVAQELPVIVES